MALVDLVNHFIEAGHVTKVLTVDGNKHSVEVFSQSCVEIFWAIFYFLCFLLHLLQLRTKHEHIF